MSCGPNITDNSKLYGVLSEYPTCQFSITPTKPPRYSITYKIPSNVRKILQQKRCYVHSTLLFNLAHSKRDDVVSKSKWSYRQCMDALKGTKTSLVVHMGKCGPLSNTIEEFNDIYKPQDPTVLFENAAGQGTEVGVSFDDMRLIQEKLDRGNNTGMCLDTCHAYAAGWYEGEDQVQILYAIEDTISSDWLKMVHFNDSKTPFGSNKDRHASHGKGYIWNELEGNDDIIEFVRYCKENDIDMILETGESALQDANYINSVT